MIDIHDAARMRSQVERLRRDRAVGGSRAGALLEFLVERAISGEQPKEVDIAVAVFGRDPKAPIPEESLIRVNVHRLRKRLERYYAGPGRQDRYQLVIAKGEYLVLLEDHVAIQLWSGLGG